MENTEMILCDTNILIEVYRGNAQIIEFLKNIGLNNVAISDVTCAELFYGARNKIELKAIRNDINKLINLPITELISSRAVQLVEKFTLSHKLSLPDALIAATSIETNIKLLTLNNKDFRFIENVDLVEIKF